MKPLTNQELLEDLFDSCTQDMLFDFEQFNNKFKFLAIRFAENFATERIKEYKTTGSTTIIVKDEHYTNWLNK